MAPHKPKPQMPTNHKGPMLVIAAGLPRCATTTIKEIFEKTLAIGPTMHMSRVLPSPPTMQLVQAALMERDTNRRRQILFKLFDGCACTADFPGHLFLEDLIEMYPDAKIVLNIRKDGAAGWSKSMKTAIAPFMGTAYRWATYWSLPDYLHYHTEVLWNKTVKAKFGVENFWDEAAYEAHNEWVKSVCKEKGRDYLVWEPSMGWDPLCSFLGMKVPAEGVPRTNDRAQMEKVIKWRIGIGMKAWAMRLMFPAVVAGGWAALNLLSVV